MIASANGETRKALAMALGAALFAAIGTKVGEWVVEVVRSEFGAAPKKRDE